MVVCTCLTLCLTRAVPDCTRHKVKLKYDEERKINRYEEHSSEKEILELQYVTENDREYIFMDWHNEDVYWKRENTASDANSPADHHGLEAEKTQIPKEILSVDGQEMKELAEKFAAVK